MQHVESPMMTLVRAVHDAGSITPEALAATLATPLGNVLYDLQELERRGWAEEADDGWSITEVGRAQLGEDEMSVLRRHNQVLADRYARMSLEAARLRRRLGQTEAA